MLDFFLGPLTETVDRWDISENDALHIKDFAMHELVKVEQRFREQEEMQMQLKMEMMHEEQDMMNEQALVEMMNPMRNQ